MNYLKSFVCRPMFLALLVFAGMVFQTDVTFARVARLAARPTLQSPANNTVIEAGDDTYAKFSWSPSRNANKYYLYLYDEDSHENIVDTPLDYGTYTSVSIHLADYDLLPNNVGDSILYSWRVRATTNTGFTYTSLKRYFYVKRTTAGKVVSNPCNTNPMPSWCGSGSGISLNAPTDGADFYPDNTGKTLVDFAWTPVPVVSYYVVSLYSESTVNNANNPPYIQDRVYANSYYSNALSATTFDFKLHWKVEAYDLNDKKIATSNSQVFTIHKTGNTSLAAPGLLTPTTGSNVQGKTAFTWNQVSGAVKYHLSVSTMPGVKEVGNYYNLDLYNNYASYDFSSLNNQVIYWKVFAYDSAGNTTASAEWYFLATPVSTTLAIPTLTNPLNSSAKENTGNLNFQWAAVNNASFYRLYIRTDANQSALAQEVYGTNYIWNTPVLTYSQTYYWKVQAVSSTGYSGDFSNEWSFRVNAGSSTTSPFFTAFPQITTPISGATLDASDMVTDVKWSVAQGSNVSDIYYDLQARKLGDNWVSICHDRYISECKLPWIMINSSSNPGAGNYEIKLSWFDKNNVSLDSNNTVSVYRANNASSNKPNISVLPSFVTPTNGSTVYVSNSTNYFYTKYNWAQGTNLSGIVYTLWKTGPGESGYSIACDGNSPDSFPAGSPDCNVSTAKGSGVYSLYLTVRDKNGDALAASNTITVNVVKN